MPYSHIIIRFAELSTKGKNKKDFINTLFSNIKFRLRHFPKILYKKTHDRIYLNIQELSLNQAQQVEQIVAEIPGISTFSFVYQSEKDIDALTELGLQLIQQQQTGNTFKIKTKRVDKTFPHSSDQINRLMANKILKNTAWKVDVVHPDMIVEVDIRPEFASIYAAKQAGIGGLPLGSSGKALLMLSGGIDSPVAGYELMKKGVKVEAVHFASPPYTSHQAKEKVIDIARSLARFSGKIRVYFVRFTPLQEAIYALNEESYAITLMRRMMYRIAQEIAIKNRCLALISGDSIGQVASQTLESMMTIDSVVRLPVFRPLLTKSKNEIIELSKAIQTHDISILPFEDCCTIFAPRNPSTKPKVNRAELLESRFDYASLLLDCLKQVEIIDVDENYQETEEINQFL